MRTIADAHGASVAQVAIAWLLSRQAVTSVLIGASKTHQLADDLKAADVTLTAEQIADLDAPRRWRRFIRIGSASGWATPNSRMRWPGAGARAKSGPGSAFEVDDEAVQDARTYPAAPHGNMIAIGGSAQGETGV